MATIGGNGKDAQSVRARAHQVLTEILTGSNDLGEIMIKIYEKFAEANLLIAGELLLAVEKHGDTLFFTRFGATVNGFNVGISFSEQIEMPHRPKRDDGDPP